MPITPHFELSQTDTHISIHIRVPHVRVNAQTVETLIEEDGTTVHFSSPPYLLLLTFGALLKSSEDGAAVCKYDPIREGGMVIMELEKEEPGPWPDLDLLGRLMRPREGAGTTTSTTNRVPKVSIISQSTVDNNNNIDNEQQDISHSTMEEHWNTNSSIIMDRPQYAYGFANMFVNIYTDLVREGMALEMLQLKNPDEVPSDERKVQRYAAEQQAFSPDRYLEDAPISDNVSEDYIYESAMTLTTFWDPIEHMTQEFATTMTTSTSYFTTDESMQLASIAYPLLPDNSCNNNCNKSQLIHGLLDLLFAFVYDHLVTQGDPTVESAWNVSTLSASLSWLDTFDDLEQVVISSLRRCLIFPYLRNFEFGMHCWRQTLTILSQGRRCILRALLKIRCILEKSDLYYFGNKLFIDPYLAWLQQLQGVGGVGITDHDLKEVVTLLQGVLNQVQKSSLGLHLDELEVEFAGYEEASDSSNASSEEEDLEESHNDKEEDPPEMDPPRRPLIEEIS